MTLNITVTSVDRIYQCADYRLSDPETGQAVTVEDRKLLLVNAFEWSATVCYTGVATLPDGRLVGDWLSDLGRDISMGDHLDTLFEGLLSADDWLSAYPLERRKLCFSIGAFDIDQPVFALVSNFADISGRPLGHISEHLVLQSLRPRKTKAYILPVPTAVTRAERRRLERLAAQKPEPSAMHEALAAVNRRVAGDDPERVSAGCYTTYLTRTGQGGSQRHGTGPAGEFGVIPRELEPTIRDLIAKQFPQGARMTTLAIARSPSNERHHRAVLEDQPDDPSAHNNFGAFLMDQKDDPEAAERHYLKALQLDPEHTNALGNLANLRWRQKRSEEAEELYRRALATDKPQPNVVENFVRFRRAVFGDAESTRGLLDGAIEAHPTNWKLRVLRAEGRIIDAPEAALVDLTEARNHGAEQLVVEPLLAFAQQLAGGDVHTCVAAYRTAIAVAPDNPELHLNLSQLLFLRGETREADKHLRLALHQGLQPSGELEAMLYELAHHTVDPGPTLRRVRELCADGARLDWDVSQNLEAVARVDAKKAEHLRVLVSVMRGDQHPDALDTVLDGLLPQQ